VLDELEIPKSFQYDTIYVELKKPSSGRIKSILENEHDAINLTENEVDIFFQPDITYGLPSHTRTVTVFYDLIPLIFWNRDKVKRFGLKKRVKVTIVEKLLRAKYKRSLSMYKKADRIIAISKSSKNDLIDKFPSIKPNNVLVTYLGANSSNATIQNTKKSTIIRRLKLDQPFVLYVGAVDVRKNIVGMARMFFKLKSEFNTDLKLVMVGKEFTNKLELEELGWNDVVAKNKYRNDIVLPGYVSDSDLEVLYKQARAFVFPSLYEGFGLPILEAMQEGCPVVAFDNSSIPEVAGGAAILANSEDEFIKGVELLLRDNKKRDDLIEAGYKQSKKFSWTKTAKQTIELWGELGRK
jgi:glycosyltransferase involved in cell wall biosynthesis